LVLKPQLFKSLKSSKAKTKTALTKTKTSKDLRPRLVRTTSLAGVRTFWCKNSELFEIYGVSARTKGRGLN